MKRLNEFAEKSAIVGEVRGKGLMIGLELVEDKQTREPAGEMAYEAMLHAWRQGVAVVTCGISTLRIVPPLTIQHLLLCTYLKPPTHIKNPPPIPMTFPTPPLQLAM